LLWRYHCSKKHPCKQPLRNPVLLYILDVVKKVIRKDHSSLLGAFITVILIVYMIIALLTFLAFSLSAKSISGRYATMYALSQNLLDKNRILSLVERELGLSLKLADDPQIKEWILQEQNQETRYRAELQLESYRRFFRDKAWFLAVRSSGNYYAKTPDTQEVMVSSLTPDNPADRWFYRTLEENRDFSLNVDHNVMLKENRVWINVLVRDTDGTAIGIAGCGMNLTAFLETLVAQKNPGITSVIINSSGDLQAHPDERLINHNAEVTKDSDKIDIYFLIDEPEDREVLRRYIEETASGDSVKTFTLSLEGKKVLSALGSIPELGWYNLVLLDQDNLFSLTDFLPLAAVILISLLTILASVIFTINRLILRPLGNLTKAAAVVAEGSYNTNLPVKTRDEIGLLSVSFNTMTEKIRHYTNNLEEMINQRTRELQNSNLLLAESQKKIIDSIEYAKLIQNSILPTPGELGRRLTNYFTLLKPLDLVGGDFYFFRDLGNDFCIAVVDCTGHGVPGAFMTMMVNALLNRIIDTLPEAGPAEMLLHLHRLVKQTLRSENEVAHLDNGLDIALGRYNREKNQFIFAGGGLPMYVAEGEEITEYPGNKIRLGFSSSKDNLEIREHPISLSENQRFYLLSDGILDLPGGDKGFGLGRARLAEIIKRGCKIDPSKQEEFFLKEFSDYKGDNGQRDDITFLGFSLSLSKEK